jgi:hypothetical protein
MTLSSGAAAAAFFALGILQLVCSPVRAEADYGGIKQIWIPGSGGASCINATTDIIAVSIARMKVSRNDSFWRDQKDVGIESQVATSANGVSFSYSQMYKQDISQLQGAIIDVPVQDVIGGRIPLHTGSGATQMVVDKFQVDTYENQTRSPSPATNILLSLQQVASSFPIAAYAPEMKIASDMSSILVGNLIGASKDEDHQTIQFGRIGKTLSHSGTHCSMSDLWTGIYVTVMKWNGIESDGFINWGQIHCFVMVDDSGGEFNIKFGSQIASGGKPGVTSDDGKIVPCSASQVLQNPYIATTIDIEDVVTSATGNDTRDTKGRPAAASVNAQTLAANIKSALSSYLEEWAVAPSRRSAELNSVDQYAQKLVRGKAVVAARNAGNDNTMITMRPPDAKNEFRAERVARCADLGLSTPSCFVSEVLAAQHSRLGGGG